jgi:hypothetical protein
MSITKYLMIGLVFMCFVPGFISSVDRPGQGAPGVILYQYPNYQGKSIGITGDVRALSAPDFRFADQASSLRLANGATSVAVYQNENFLGNCRTFTGDVPSLIGTNFNNKISSIKVNGKCQSGGTAQAGGVMSLPQNERGVRLYQKINYGGLSILVDGEIPDLKDGRYNFDNRTSSLKLLGNIFKVAVWEEANFIGNCAVITNRQIPSLVGKPIGINKISSLIVDQDCDCKKYIKVTNTNPSGWMIKLYKANTNQSVLLHKKYLSPSQVFAVSFPKENPVEGIDVVIESLTLSGYVKVASVWCKLNDSHEFRFNLGWGSVMHRWGSPWCAWEPASQ